MAQKGGEKNNPCPQSVQEYDSGISSIWQRPMLGSYTVVTFVSIENHIRVTSKASKLVSQTSKQSLT